MTSNPTLRCRWLSRTFGALFVLVALAGTALDAVPAAARETDETPLDLAAMALTPDDLSSAGLDGYGVGDGGTLAPDAVAAAFSDPAVMDAMAKQGTTIRIGTSAQAQSEFKSELAKYASLVKKAGIEPQ